MSRASQRPEVIAAGHLCLDIVPDFDRVEGDVSQMLTPGKLVSVGAARTTGGGSVANTGLALHRLGVRTRLLGKVGADAFGDILLDLIDASGEGLASGIIVSSEPTSYTIVLSPPGTDRMFLHNSGANDSFQVQDAEAVLQAGARIFHFGYPPLIKSMYENEGRELARLLENARAAGMVTSLDMAYPDPNSEAGRVDWKIILERVLPSIDVFLPSLDELRFMLGDRQPTAIVDGQALQRLGGMLIGMGCGAAVIKLGEAGLYLKTSDEPERVQRYAEPLDLQRDSWTRRELLAPCYDVRVSGTTGAGDATIAGFLAGTLRGLTPEKTVSIAVSAGSFSVQSADRTDGIPNWDSVLERTERTWPRLESRVQLDDWRWADADAVWLSPSDAHFNPEFHPGISGNER